MPCIATTVIRTNSLPLRISNMCVFEYLHANLAQSRAVFNCHELYGQTEGPLTHALQSTAHYVGLYVLFHTAYYNT